MSVIYAVAAQITYRPAKPERDPAYLRFIRRLPCSVCNSRKQIEAAHMGPRGLGQKADDRSAIPLCARCHQHDTYSLHKLGPVTFAEMHNLDVAALTAKLNKFFDEKIRGRKQP